MQKLIARVTDPEEREKGFTLIELLVVIIIIGILAAIAIPIFLNQKKKAAGASVKSDVRNAVSAVESSMTENPSHLGPYTAQDGYTYAMPGFTARTSSFKLDDGTDIVVSSGNTLQGWVSSTGTEGYCLKGSNPDASPSVVFYDSALGNATSGAVPTGGACAAANAS